VLIDLQSLGALEKRLGVRHGALGKAFREALDSYADIAGFSGETGADIS
jgi:hypothetical protein